VGPGIQGCLGTSNRYLRMLCMGRPNQNVSVLSKTVIPPSQPAQSRAMIKPTSVVYWMRFFLAIMAAFAEQLLHVNVLTLGSDLAQIAGVGVGIVFYLLSVMIVKYLLRYDDAALKGKNRQITLGGGTFIFIWIMVTVLLNTLSVG